MKLKRLKQTSKKMKFIFHKKLFIGVLIIILISFSYQEKVQKVENVKSNSYKFMKTALLTNEFEKLNSKIWHEADVVNRKTSDDTFMASSLADKDTGSMRMSSGSQGTVTNSSNSGTNPSFVGTRSNNGANQGSNTYSMDGITQQKSEFTPTNRSANSNYVGNTQARTVANSLTGGYGGSRTGDGGYNGAVGGLRYGEIGNSNMSGVGNLGFATPAVAVPVVPKMVDPLIEPLPPRIISPPMATYTGAVLPGAATIGISNMGRVGMGVNTFSAGGLAGVGGINGVGGSLGLGPMGGLAGGVGVGPIGGPLRGHSTPAIVPVLRGGAYRGGAFSGGHSIHNGFHAGVHRGIGGHGHLMGYRGVTHFQNDNNYYGQDNEEESENSGEQENDNEADVYSRIKSKSHNNKTISDEEKVSKIKDNLEKDMSSYNLNEELNVLRFHLDKKELDKVNKEVRIILGDIKADPHKIERRSVDKVNRTINSIIKDINKLKNLKQESPKNSYYQSSSKKILPVLFEIKDFINAHVREESIKNHPVENSHSESADITEITIEAANKKRKMKKERKNLKKFRNHEDDYILEDEQIDSDDSEEEDEDDEDLEETTKRVNKSTLRKLEKRIDELTDKVKLSKR